VILQNNRICYFRSLFFDFDFLLVRSLFLGKQPSKHF